MIDKLTKIEWKKHSKHLHLKHQNKYLFKIIIDAKWLHRSLSIYRFDQNARAQKTISLRFIPQFVPMVTW